ncbi:Alpha/Beta hydrolase protein [Sporodiniella umbellata]|nr:Alpha/Beta hydrolase protein [Sporodiniella umbellata]
MKDYLIWAGLLYSINASAFSTIYNYYITGPPAKSWSLLSDITFKSVHHFIDKTSSLTVEDVQKLSTTLKPPVSPFLKRTKFVVPKEYRQRAGELLESMLTPDEKQRVGWDWNQKREEEPELKGEWLQNGTPTESVVLYLHGGAYYICNYQMYRPFLSKLIKYSNCRTCSFNYRLAPQRPFPAALEDSLATYLYLIDPPKDIKPIDPKNIVISGDSAGGGLTMALLLAIRDARITPPGGAMPISPWVDLTHSLPSILTNMLTDFLPATGFKHAPSPALDYSQLPQRQQDSKTLSKIKEKSDKAKRRLKATVSNPDENRASIGPMGIPVPPSENDEEMYRIQFYAPNDALKIPMVSPIFDRKRLRGLPPLLIQCGKSERLRDESLYLSLEASGTFRNNDEEDYGKPTTVTLEVYEDQPHVFQIMFITTKPTKRATKNLASFVCEVTGPPLESPAYFPSEKHLTVKEICPRGKTTEATEELLKHVDSSTWSEWKKRLDRPSLKERVDEVTRFCNGLSK